MPSRGAQVDWLQTGILNYLNVLSPPSSGNTMARWPRHAWTTLFTYGIIFVGFPTLCVLFWMWVRGRPLI